MFSSFKTYDDLDRLETETDSYGRILEYAYDNVGNRSSLTDPDGNRTVYEYDDLNRLDIIRLNANTPEETAVDYEYYPDGLKERVTNPNGTVSDYVYDAADRLTSIRHTGPSGVISSYQYTYTPNSNRQKQVETNAGRTETTSYTYDAVNRLETATYEDTTPNARTTTYTYDQTGNRLTEQEIEAASAAFLKNLEYDYDAINRLNGITDHLDPTQNVAYTYDPNGNTTSKTKNTVTTNFKYDVRDQLGEVVQGGSVLGRYGYDYDGRRILKIGDDGRVHYTYDQLSVVTEASDTGQTVSKYDYGLDQLVSLNNRVEGRSFFHLDALRSTINLTDGGGSTRQSILYDAWGNERERVGTSANKFTFTGHEKDEETGLIYAKARFYDPDVGRFLNQDTFFGDINNPPSLHRYTYAHSNPLLFVDPTGTVAVIQRMREKLRALKQEVIDAGVELEEADPRDPATTGMTTGFLAGVVGLADKALGVVNTGLNIAIMHFGSAAKDSEFVLTSVGELATNIYEFNTMAETIQEDPLMLGEIAWSSAKSGGMKLYDASQGDVRAISEVTASATEITGEIVVGSKVGLAMSRKGTIASELLQESIETGMERSTRVALNQAGRVRAPRATGGGLSAASMQTTTLKGGETFYRAMSRADFDAFVKTGKVPATSETFISPTKTFSEGYRGVVVEFNVKPGTTDALKGIGVRDSSKIARRQYGDLPTVSQGWKTNNAYFKGEGAQVNIGLGKGKALETFNNNIQGYTVVRE